MLYLQGRPQDLAGGGGQEFFFQIWKFACRFATCCAWRSHALCYGVSGACPPRNFLKWCNLVRFGVYFDQMLSLKNFKNYHFYIKNLKIATFLYKRINILDIHDCYGVIILVMMHFGMCFEIFLNNKWLFSCRNTTNYSCTHMLGSSVAYASSPEKILKMWCRLVCFEVYFDQVMY